MITCFLFHDHSCPSDNTVTNLKDCLPTARIVTPDELDLPAASMESIEMLCIRWFRWQTRLIHYFI